MKKNALDKKYLEAAAHAYVATSKQAKVSKSREAGFTKGICRVKLQIEALRYAADLLEELSPSMPGASRKVSGGVKILKELLTGSEAMLKMVEGVK